MLSELKKVRKLKPEARRETKEKGELPGSLYATTLLKGLSLSFYGEDTIRKNKQIIYDNCDTSEELALISTLFSRQNSRESRPKQPPKLKKR
jgi:hypothetical protein